MTRRQPQRESSTTTTTTTRDRLAALAELKEATTHMLTETRYAARMQHAHLCAANAYAKFMPFTNDCGIKADEPTTGTKPCK
jgi:hypothetical protein